MAASIPLIRVTAMPADTNSYGGVFGGWLMSQMALAAGEKRPYVIDDSLQIATIMSATGSFDHRAIDGADGARLMKAFKALVENPLGMVV